MKKTRVLSFERFNELSERLMRNDASIDEYYPEDTVLIVVSEKAVCADLHTKCVSSKTAVKRFFQQLKALEICYTEFEKIVFSKIVSWDESGFLKSDKMEDSGYCWSIENLGDGEWYIYLNIMLDTHPDFVFLNNYALF